MNAFASRGVEGVGFGRVMRKPRLSKRPRTFVAALIGTWVAFMWLVNRYYHKDEATVWIWMGIRSDDRCGRDFGTDHVQHTTCGKGSCCSSHGWCGTSEEYCSVALGCQSGCWKVDAEEQQRIDAKKANGVDDDEGYHRRYDDDDEHGDHNYRYDDYPGSHHDRYYRDRYHHGGYHHGMDDDEGYHDYNHRYDEGAHDYHDEDHHGDEEHHGDADEHGHHEEHEHGHHEEHDHYGDHGGYGEHPDDQGHGAGHGEQGAEHDDHHGH